MARIGKPETVVFLAIDRVLGGYDASMIDVECDVHAAWNVVDDPPVLALIGVRGGHLEHWHPDVVVFQQGALVRGSFKHRGIVVDVSHEYRQRHFREAWQRSEILTPERHAVTFGLFSIESDGGDDVILGHVSMDEGEGVRVQRTVHSPVLARVRIIDRYVSDESPDGRILGHGRRATSVSGTECVRRQLWAVVVLVEDVYHDGRLWCDRIRSEIFGGHDEMINGSSFVVDDAFHVDTSGRVAHAEQRAVKRLRLRGKTVRDLGTGSDIPIGGVNLEDDWSALWMFSWIRTSYWDVVNSGWVVVRIKNIDDDLDGTGSDVRAGTSVECHQPQTMLTLGLAIQLLVQDQLNFRRSVQLPAGQKTEFVVRWIYFVTSDAERRTVPVGGGRKNIRTSGDGRFDDRQMETRVLKSRRIVVDVDDFDDHFNDVQILHRLYDDAQMNLAQFLLSTERDAVAVDLGRRPNIAGSRSDFEKRDRIGYESISEFLYNVTYVLTSQSGFVDYISDLRSRRRLFGDPVPDVRVISSAINPPDPDGQQKKCQYVCDGGACHLPHFRPVSLGNRSYRCITLPSSFRLFRSFSIILSFCSSFIFCEYRG